MNELLILSLAALALHCAAFGIAWRRGLKPQQPSWHTKISVPQPRHRMRGCALFQAVVGIALIIALALVMAACFADEPRW